MGHFSDHSDSVRVDFFRETGKWYCTEAVRMNGCFEGGNLIDIFEQALYRHLLTELDGGVLSVRLRGMWAVCLDPYHEHSHPLMRRVPSGVCRECAALVFGEGVTSCASCADERGLRPLTAPPPFIRDRDGALSAIEILTVDRDQWKRRVLAVEAELRHRSPVVEAAIVYADEYAVDGKIAAASLVLREALRAYQARSKPAAGGE
jgi:hypothetical protein